jgi:tetratricopeptide (TPR) repeat protein
MAHASGPATENLKPADFVHARSGVHYRIYGEDNTAWLSFERPGDPAVRGKRRLLYYIGSGRRGRSYLFAVDGFLFESPVNWYANKQLWDMAPAYGNASEIPMNLPAFPSCLNCHTSGMNPPLQGTENRYPVPVFAFPGVTCERCHGPGAAHLQGGAIVNPAKLSPEKRDAVCMQCHEEGNVAIERAGRHLYQFQPGEDLSQYIRYYDLVGGAGQGLAALSQVEALAQSVCKRKSGSAMSCTSCHDPHDSPPAAERISYYRAKCLTCHGTSLGGKHHPEQPDCRSCHMPASESTDVAHTQVTDHRILPMPARSPQGSRGAMSAAGSPRLVPFPDSREAQHDVRDLALAWESLAESGMTMADSQAEHWLRVAAKHSPDDPALLSALGYIEQKHGATDRARELYQKALAITPSLLDACTNLGVIKAESGDLQGAVTLWRSAFERAPGRSSIGMNLARAYCRTRNYDEARRYTMRVLEFNPDLSEGKRLLRDLNASPPGCGN